MVLVDIARLLSCWVMMSVGSAGEGFGVASAAGEGEEEERRRGERVDLTLCRNPRDILAGRDAQVEREGMRDVSDGIETRSSLEYKSPTRPGIYTYGTQYSRTGLARPGRVRAGLSCLPTAGVAAARPHV